MGAWEGDIVTDADIDMSDAEHEANSHTLECGVFVYEVQECDCK